jgi:ATP phosphoribosyltransferase
MKLTEGIESGETMRVAGLKAIATVVESSAVLIQSRHPTDPKLVEKIKARIKGWIGKSLPLPLSSIPIPLMGHVA